MARKSTSAATVDDFGLLSAIWILSCNDQIPYMTYEGIKQRLGLPPEYDVRGLIAGHGELFRARVPNERLNEWKKEMLAGQRLPSWIREKAESQDRRAAIEGLRPEDLFRNQFRTEANAPRADLEVIRWGLEHVESLRSVQVELREARIKKWTSMGIPVLSIIVALTAVVSGAFLQWANIQTQRTMQQQTLEAQRYQVESSPKLQAYSSLTDLMRDSLLSACQGDDKATSSSLQHARLAYFKIVPFLNEPARGSLSAQLENYEKSCSGLAAEKDENRRWENCNNVSASLTSFDDELVKDLFPRR